MRIAYCDDEKAQYIFLKKLTDEWGRAGNKQCNITVYTSAEEMLFKNQESYLFDFILLDIELDKMNGIELAERIRAVDKRVFIAFLSNSREYVFKGYEVGAVRYLLKPLEKEQLFPLLDLIQGRIGEERQYLVIGAAGEKIKLDVEDICYVEALGHYIMIHTDDQTYELKMNMNEIADRLKTGFIATHRSYLVNLSRIERITRKDCIVAGKVAIPISRNSYQSVNQAFIEFYKGGEA